MREKKIYWIIEVMKTMEIGMFLDEAHRGGKEDSLMQDYVVF